MLANIIGVFLMAIGGIIGPVLAQSLISSHGWRGGYVALGLVSLVLTPLVAQVLHHSPERIGTIPYGEDQSRQAELAAMGVPAQIEAMSRRGPIGDFG